MNNKPMNRWPLVCFAIMLGGLLLTGCISNNAPAPDHYLINDDPDVANLSGELPGEALVIELRAVRLPPYLERKAIVTRDGPNQLHFSDRHRWGGKLHRNLSRVMASQLSRMLGGARVVVSPRSLPLKPRFLLEVELLQFERLADGRVALQANWRLVDAQDSMLVNSGDTNLTSEPLARLDDYPTIVASMSRLFGQLSRQLASAIADAAAA